jgi:acetoin utilization protein AcuB
MSRRRADAKEEGMRHPTRALTREVRTRRPKRPGSDVGELETGGWPERAVRVSEAMTRPAITVSADATVGLAWKLMRLRKVRHLPVLDKAGGLVGIVSDRDLRQVILEPAIQEQLGNMSRALNILTVKEVMTWGVVSVRPDTEIRQAARIMHEQKIGALPVTDRGKLLGMLTGDDLLKALLRILDEGVVSRPVRWGREA